MSACGLAHGRAIKENHSYINPCYVYDQKCQMSRNIHAILFTFDYRINRLSNDSFELKN